MALVQWNDALSVKIKKFDDQHKKLFTLINEFYEAMSQGKGKEAVSGVLESLCNYTQTHFKEEEGFLKKHNYPDFDEHHKEHTNFVNNVADYKKQFEAGSLTTTVQVCNFLSTWLAQHIKKSDAKYGQVLAGKSI